jgi:hypothetical protein
MLFKKTLVDVTAHILARNGFSHTSSGSGELSAARIAFWAASLARLGDSDERLPDRLGECLGVTSSC